MGMALPFLRDGDAAREFTRNVNVGMGLMYQFSALSQFWRLESFNVWRSFNSWHGRAFYTKLKTVTARWPSGIKDGAVFNFHSGSETK